MFATETYALLIMAFFLILGYLAVRLPVVSRAFLPNSLMAGLILLLVGPQVAGQFIPDYQLSAQFYAFWSQLPKQLINVVFACLFLARPLLSAKKMWKVAGPHVAFGQTIAWGQYALGGLLTLFILTPFFGARDLHAALIEMSFEGGHGTVAGMGPVFTELNFKNGQDLAVGLATVSLCTALISGVILINWGRKKGHIKTVMKSGLRERIYHRRITYELRKKGVALRDHLTLKKVTTHVVLIAVSIFFAWIIFQTLVLAESVLFSDGQGFMRYVPFFPFCMFGGIIAQAFWSKIGFKTSRPLIELISSITLSLLIASAIATMSLEYISSHIVIFGLLSVTGIVWILLAFVLFARRMFRHNWFQNGIVNAGQSMGMTATGLLFLHMVDPHDKTNAMEGFGYKQLMFEPFVGGGIVTALALPAIIVVGLPLFTAITSVICILWLLFGLFYFGKR